MKSQDIFLCKPKISMVGLVLYADSFHILVQGRQFYITKLYTVLVQRIFRNTMLKVGRGVGIPYHQHMSVVLCRGRVSKDVGHLNQKRQSVVKRSPPGQLCKPQSLTMILLSDQKRHWEQVKTVKNLIVNKLVNINHNRD